MQGNAHQDVILSSAGVTASVVLAEPTIFLSGFSKHEQSQRPPALLRGSLVIKIAKPTKIKAITLNFKGISRTEWPEGIPNDKSETSEVKEVFSHEWRLFSTQANGAESSSGAHSISPLDGETKISESETISPSLSSPHTIVNQHEAVIKGYRVFNPAEYIYNIELILPQRFPESMKCNFGQVRWSFNLSIERHGTFKPRLTGQKEITLLRTLGPSNLEYSEPIVISRDWEDLLHYEIIIAGKAFAIGQSFNVAFALVPMAKVKCHRIRIYITEHTEYFCRNRRIHRVEPSHKFLLLEKKSPDGNRGNLLNSVPDSMSGLTEFEFDVQIPESFPSRREYLRPNANTENIKVYHWVKAVMRLSREDIQMNGEPKCYEVSIDSPVTLVDPRTLQVNDLPDYSTARQRGRVAEALKPYQEFIQKDTRLTAGGSPGDAQGRSNRAILFARQPSIAPPPFDADTHPPELFPPQYDLSSENVFSYEQRYEEYLLSTGRIPPGERGVTTTEGTSSNSDFSTFSQSSDSAAASASVNTRDSSNTSESTNNNSSAIDAAASKAAHNKTWADKARDNPQQINIPGGSPNLVPPVSIQNGQVPIFSEIIWSEDHEENHLETNDEMVDPRHVQVTETTRPNSLSGTESTVLTQQTTPEPDLDTKQTDKESADSPASSRLASNRPKYSPIMSPDQSPRGGFNSTPSRPIATRGSLTNSKMVGFSPRTSGQSRVQKLRVSANGTGSNAVGNIPINNLNIAGRRSNSNTHSRLSLKSSGAFSHSAGSSLTSPWSENNSSSAVGESLAFSERRDSAGSIVSSSPRYFRQSSVVSMDVTRQGEYYRRDSRRPSRVGEVRELQGWQPLNRSNSETSIAVSIAEYRSLHNDSRQQQTRALLQGDQESEIDIGLEWEHDFEDYDIENDRGSITSAFYTVLTP